MGENLNSFNYLKLACGALICALLFLQENSSSSQTNIGDGVFYVRDVGKISTPTPTPVPSSATQPIGQVTELGDGAPWTKIDNLKDCEDGYAYVVLSPLEKSNTLLGDLYDWASILSGSETLVGMQNGLINYIDTDTGTVTPVRINWYMHQGGTPLGSVVQDNIPLDGSLQSYQLGSATDLSGFGITASDVTPFSFGFAFQVENLSASDGITFELECVNMTLYWYP